MNQDSTGDRPLGRLSPRTLRILHRYLDDFVAVKRAKSGGYSVPELRQALRAGRAPAEEIEYAIEEYRKMMTAGG